MHTTNPYTTSNHSTETALSLLELLARSKEPMRLIEISDSLGANTSTISRFLNTLINCGYAEQDPDTQRYHLTYKICSLACSVQENTELRTITHPYLVALSKQFNEASCVSVERNMSMVYIDTCSPQGQSLMSRQRLGECSPMHCTGNGKLALLNYNDDQINELIACKGLTGLTVNTYVTKEALINELTIIRRQGYAEDREECEIGVRCLAYPITDYTGKIVAGISLTGPTTRMTGETTEAMKISLAQAAREISRTLGAKQI